jgi:hypothetical protein
MDEADLSPQPRLGFTVLDGAGLVSGAAVSAVHLRHWGEQPLHLAGWILPWLAFSGVAITAAGPLILGLRRLSGQDGGRLRLGDVLWLLLGLPWLVSAPWRPAGLLMLEPPTAPARRYALSLGVPLAVCGFLAMGLLWSRWVQRPDAQRNSGRRPAWTERVGIALAIASPLQWGFLLIVLG